MAVLDTRRLEDAKRSFEAFIRVSRNADDKTALEAIHEVLRLRRVLGRILTATKRMTEHDRDLVRGIVEYEGVSTDDL